MGYSVIPCSIETAICDSFTLRDEFNNSVIGQINKLLFRNAVGLHPRTFNGIFAKLMRESGLLRDAGGSRRTLYSLRHTYVTLELLAGTDIHTLAKQMGTSVRMLEQHYSKLTTTLAAERLA